MNEIDISIVIPVYNSEETIERLVKEMNLELKNKYKFNFTLVNDGSSDGSYDICKKMAMEDRHVKFISFFKNFGQTNAIIAGLREADGNIVIVMDDDFQNPPNEVHKLINSIKKGYDFVYGTPSTKPKQKLWRRFVSCANAKVAEIVYNKPKNLHVSSYYAMRIEVVKEVIGYNGPYPHMTGLILRTTGNGCSIPVEHHPRASGKSGYTLSKLVLLWLRGFTNFSIIPLRLSTMIGITTAASGFVLLLFIIIRKLIYSDIIASGWSSIVAIILVFTGIQLIILGMIGEYVGRIFLLLNKTPQFTIKEKYNCIDK